MWRLWQWIDSAFPTGAYAHSAGLEAWAHLAPRGADPEAAIASLLRSQAQLAVPFVRAAFAGEDPALLDAEYDACLWGESAHRASRAQGLALVFARVLDVWIDDDEVGLDRTMAALDRALTSGQRWSGFLDDLCSIPERFARRRRRRRDDEAEAEAA